MFPAIAQFVVMYVEGLLGLGCVLAIWFVIALRRHLREQDDLSRHYRKHPVARTHLVRPARRFL